MQPNDPDALQTKLFLLLTTNQSEAALSLIGADQDDQSNMFERAYALYCLHHRAETREALEEVKQKEGENEHRGVMHLEAQLVCRLPITFLLPI